MNTFKNVKKIIFSTAGQDSASFELGLIYSIDSRDKHRLCVEKQRHYSANKGLYSQGYGLPSGHMWLWELDGKKDRVPRNWRIWTVVLEKTPESPLDSREIEPVNLKGNHWTLIGRTDAEASVFWSPDDNSWLIGSPWCWEWLRAGEEGIRGWDGWMASPMQWTWTWANSGRWWGAGRTGVLQSMRSQSQTQLGDWTIARVASYLIVLLLYFSF